MSAEARQAQLLDCARDIVAAEGFAALTIDRVARAAEVTRTVVYQNFGDLAGLMSALLERESGIAFAGMRSVVGPLADDPDAVGRGILAYLHAAPTSWRIILSPPAGAPPQLQAHTELGRRYARGIAADRLSGLAGRAVDADGATARLLLSALEELALLHLTDPRAYPDELVLRYLRSLVGWAVRLETTMSSGSAAAPVRRRGPTDLTRTADAGEPNVGWASTGPSRSGASPRGMLPSISRVAGGSTGITRPAAPAVDT